MIFTNQIDFYKRKIKQETKPNEKGTKVMTGTGAYTRACYYGYTLAINHILNEINQETSLEEIRGELENLVKP